MITDRLPYNTRVSTLNDDPDGLGTFTAELHEAPEVKRKDLRPILILGLVVAYSFTITLASITIINIQGTSVARACIENGGEWVLNDGTRECRR